MSATTERVGHFSRLAPSHRTHCTNRVRRGSGRGVDLVQRWGPHVHDRRAGELRP